MGGGFTKLIAWQKAYELALEIYRETKSFPRHEFYSLTAQLRRAAVSVPANVAEGYDRQYRKEYMQFLMIARGSLAELETFLSLSRDLAYLSESSHRKLELMRRDAGRTIWSLIGSLRS